MGVLATGYPSLDHIARVSHSPTVGETARLHSRLQDHTFGGCGANIAVGLARLGHRAGAALVLGDDLHGAAYLAYLAQAGVDTDNCLCLSGEKTSHSYIFMNPAGQYQNFFFPGAADAWRGPLALTGLDRYRFAVVTVGHLDYNYAFIQHMATANIPLVWVMKPDVYAYPAAMLREFLVRSRYLLLNHIEADYILTTLKRAQLTDLLSNGPAVIVLTQGADGVTVVDRTGQHQVPAVPPQVVIDTTGAGDGFAAGFLAGLLRGHSPLVAARCGVVVASFVVEQIGCQTNLPDWAVMQTRYEAYFGPLEGEP